MNKESLTLEELQELAGKPVYCPEIEAYGIVKCETIGIWAGVPFLVGASLVHFIITPSILMQKEVTQLTMIHFMKLSPLRSSLIIWYSHTVKLPKSLKHT